MKGWKSHLHASVIPWLLENDNPSVKYLTLKEIHEKPKTHPKVLTASKNIMITSAIPKILAKQTPGGYWEKAEDFYIRTKYRRTGNVDS